MADLHIAISAEPLFNVGPITITNSMLVSWIVVALLCLFAFSVSSKIKSSGKSKGMLALAEFIIESLLNMVAGVVGERKAKEVFPVIATFFLFILFGNWFGLLPGVGSIGFIRAHEFVPIFRGATADINITLGLALSAVGLVQFFGLKHLGLGYLTKFFNFKNPINFFIGILELIAEFARILSFAFRLFGNIFAGEVLLSVIAFLVPIIAPLPFMGLELFVGLVQALVFSMLTLVFIQMATIAHIEETSKYES